MVNPESYLRSLCETYAQWWNCYTLTDVLGKKQDEEKMGSASGVLRSSALRSPLLDIGLMVETLKQEKESRDEISEVNKSREEKSEKSERLTLLDGLRKYAGDHVLLVGRPGSGKSTALVRLLLEEAEEAQNHLKTIESSTTSQFKLTSAMSQEIDFLVDSGAKIHILV